MNLIRIAFLGLAVSPSRQLDDFAQGPTRRRGEAKPAKEGARGKKE
jgi:hypothetical protein